MDKSSINATNSVNKTIYLAMMTIAVVFALLLHDFAMSASALALSVVFYPFDAQTRWPDKSLLQKSLALSHIVVAVMLVAYSLFVVVQ